MRPLRNSTLCEPESTLLSLPISTAVRPNSGFVARVWLFGLATVATALFIGFASLSVWKHLATLGNNLNRTQSQSFDIANQFQRNFFRLNSHLLLYEIDPKS